MRQTMDETRALRSLMAWFIQLVARQDQKPTFDEEGMAALDADNTTPVYVTTREIIAIARLLKNMEKPKGWRDGDMQNVYELAAKAEQSESDNPDYLLHTMMYIHGLKFDIAPPEVRWGDDGQTLTFGLTCFPTNEPVLPWLAKVPYRPGGGIETTWYTVTEAVLTYTDDDAVLTFTAHPADARQVEVQNDGDLFPHKEWEGECSLPSDALTPSSKKELADYMLKAIDQDPEEMWPLRQHEPGSTWFAPRHSVVEVDGIPVPTAYNEFCSANILGVEVGTNGFQGGDTGHGGRTFLRFKNQCSTDMRCRFVTDYIGEVAETQEADEVTITLGGDCELSTFAKALRFAADVLEMKISGKLMLVVPANLERGTEK